MFTSKVAISNNFDDYRPSDNEMRSHLSKYFSMPQLHLIESAFEELGKGSTSISGNILMIIIWYLKKNIQTIMIEWLLLWKTLFENKGTFKP